MVQPQRNRHTVRDSWRVEPKHVAETVKHVSAVTPDGSTISTTTSVTHHDGVAVRSKVSHDIRQKRIHQLEASGAQATLGGSKKPEYIKLYITLVDPDTTPESMEISVLQAFPDVERAVVRKHRMHKSTSYCSFSVFVCPRLESNLKLDDFINYSWPDDIKCYPHTDQLSRRV